jgi:dTDP-4-amino-4,6-dideoxygalactose transaminase
VKRVRFNDVKAINSGIAAELRAAFESVLENHEFILGGEVVAFEEAWKELLSAQFAIGCASGTDALVLALHALGIGPGDEVITTPLTYFATVEAVASTGAKPVLVDVEPDSGLIDPAKIEQAITSRTRALLPVHIFGQPAAMGEIMAIARRRSLKCIEDAAQAHGVYLDGKALGTIGDVGCYSFFPGKNLGALGDAGALATQNAALAEKLVLLRDHGRRGKQGHDKYLHFQMAGNYRMDGMQAAFLRAKLKHMKEWDERRRKVCEIYRGELQGIRGLRLLPAAQFPKERGALHLFVILHPERDRLEAALREAGVETGIHYPVPCHLQPGWKDRFGESSFPKAEEFSKSCLSLPLSGAVSDDDARFVAGQVRKVILGA